MMAVTPVEVFEIEGEQEINMVDGYSNVEKSQTTKTPQFPRLTFRPELDGLRTLAVVPVVLYHFNLSFPGGFAGVDVFFVISGYLITSVILSGLEAGTFSFRHFWVRRCRRLFPASTAMVLIMLFVANFLLLGAAYEKMSNQATATQLIGANFYFYTETTSYFFDPFEVPLLHCWSLAVEEQFYTIFPFFVWVIWIWSGLRYRCQAVSASFVVIFIASFVASLYVASGTNSMFGFYLLPCRAWEMIMGSLVVVAESYFRRRILKLITISTTTSRIIREIAGWAGIGMIVLSYFVLDHHVPWPSYPTLLPCIGTVLFISSNTSYTLKTQPTPPTPPETVETKKKNMQEVIVQTLAKKQTKPPSLTTHGFIVGIKPLVIIGGASYSIYLWHWPIFVFISYKSTLPDNALSPNMTAVGLVASFGAGFISWLTIEPLFRSPPSSKKMKTSATPSILSNADTRFLCGVFIVWVAMLIFTTLGASQFGVHGSSKLYGSRNNSDKTSFNSTNSTQRCMDRLTNIEEYTTFKADIATITKDSVINSKAWSQHTFAWQSYGATYAGPADKPVKIVFIGNSHMQNWATILSTLGIEYGNREGYRVGFLMRGGEYGQFYHDSSSLLPRYVTLNGDKYTWDDIRLKYLEEWNGGIDINDGNIELIVRADQWGATWYKRNFNNDYDFEYEFSLLAARSRRVLYLGDLPRLSVGGSHSGGNAIARWALSTYESQPENEHSWAFLQQLREEPTWAATRTTAELRIQAAASKIGESYSGRVDYMELASTFLIPDGISTNGKYIQVIDSCTKGIIYIDAGHVNEDAGYWLEGRFREFIFNETMCNMSNIRFGWKPAFSCGDL